MTILEDGRAVLTRRMIEMKVWESLKGWVVDDPNNPKYLIPNFPPCSKRELIQICLPCGRKSNRNYHCHMEGGLVSVMRCLDCVEKGRKPDEPEPSAPPTPAG